MLDRLNVELFQGLDVAVFKAVESDDPEQIAEHVARFRGFGGMETHNVQPVASTVQGGILTVTSAGPDGSLLEVRVAEP